MLVGAWPSNPSCLGRKPHHRSILLNPGPASLHLTCLHGSARPEATLSWIGNLQMDGCHRPVSAASPSIEKDFPPLSPFPVSLAIHPAAPCPPPALPLPPAAAAELPLGPRPGADCCQHGQRPAAGHPAHRRCQGLCRRRHSAAGEDTPSPSMWHTCSKRGCGGGFGVAGCVGKLWLDWEPALSGKWRASASLMHAVTVRQSAATAASGPVAKLPPATHTRALIHTHRPISPSRSARCCAWFPAAPGLGLQRPPSSLAAARQPRYGARFTCRACRASVLCI